MSSREEVRRLHDLLLDEAESLAERNATRAAVVIAHAAVEVCMARALEALLVHAQPPDSVLSAVAKISRPLEFPRFGGQGVVREHSFWS